MVKIDKKLTSLLLVSLFVFAVTFVPIAYARDGESSGDDSSTSSSTEIEQEKSRLSETQREKFEARKTEIEKRTQEREAARQEKTEKLEAKRLENCQKKENSINNAMDRITARKIKQVEVFTKISDRVQAFYTEKGLTVDNYDALVQDVNDKKAAVLAEVQNLEDNNVDFMCDSDNPLKVSDAFKSARDGLVTAMKDYKTSVKNLIVAVKQAAESNSDTTEGTN